MTKCDFCGLPKVSLKVTPRVTFRLEEWLNNDFFRVKKWIFGLLLGLLWGRPQKSLSSDIEFFGISGGSGRSAFSQFQKRTWPTPIISVNEIGSWSGNHCTITRKRCIHKFLLLERIARNLTCQLHKKQCYFWINFPKIALHMLICNSENCMQNCDWFMFGESQVSYIKSTFEWMFVITSGWCVPHKVLGKLNSGNSLSYRRQYQAVWQKTIFKKTKHNKFTICGALTIAL